MRGVRTLTFVPQKRNETLDEVLNDVELMTMVLQAHVVPNMELFTDDLVDGTSLPSLAGIDISVEEQGTRSSFLPLLLSTSSQRDAQDCAKARLMIRMETGRKEAGGKHHKT